MGKTNVRALRTTTIRYGVGIKWVHADGRERVTGTTFSTTGDRALTVSEVYGLAEDKEREGWNAHRYGPNEQWSVADRGFSKEHVYQKTVGGK